MNIKVYQNRKLLKENDNFGSQNENLATTMIFEFPEFIEKNGVQFATKYLNKTIVFEIEGDNELPISDDNKFSFPYDITKLGEVNWNVALKETSDTQDMTDKLIWYSETMTSKFGKSNEGHNEITIEKLDAFNVVTTILNEKIAEVEELKVDIGDYKVALDNKVDKEKGKGLSTNDFTDILKEKLENLENYNDTEIRDLLNESLKGVNYTASNGILTFTKNDGSTISVDLPLELLIESGRYDEDNSQIVLVLANGSSINIPVSDLLDDFYGKGEIDKKLGERDDVIDGLKEENQSQAEKITALENENKNQADKIKELEEEVESLEADYIPNTITGETVVISNGRPKSKVSVIGDGNYYQDTREGYNLLDYSELGTKTDGGITLEYTEDGYIVGNGTQTANWVQYWNKIITDLLEDGETYTLWAEDYSEDLYNKGYYLQVQGIKADGSANVQWFTKDKNATFKVDKSIYSEYIIGIQTSNTSVTLTNKKNRFMLYKGTDNKSWEQYGAKPSLDYPSDIEVIDGANLLKIDETNWALTDKGIKNLNRNSGIILTNEDVNLKANITYYLNLVLFSKPTDATTFGVKIDNVQNDNVGFTSLEKTSYVIGRVYTKTYTPIKDEKLSIIMWGNNNSDIFEFQYWITTSATAPYLPYGHIGLVQRGKNLLNINTSSKTTNGVTVTNNGDGTITLNGTPTAGANIPISDMRINANIGEKVTLTHKYISGKVTRHTGAFILLLYYAQATTEPLFVNKTETISNTQTVKENITATPYLWLGYDVANGQGFVTFDNYTFALQVEKGEVSTEIEPYIEPIVHSIDLAGNSLAKVNTIKDLLNIGLDGSVKIGDKVIKEYVFTGDETISKIGHRFALSLLKGLIVGSASPDDISPILSNMLIARSPNETYLKNDGISVDTDGTIRIYLAEKEEVTVDEFKTFLKELYDAGTPLKIMYATTNPTTIDLPSIEPIELFEGTNVFELVTNLGTTMAVTYKISNKSLDKRISALESALIGG